ncbi:hypothetical protein [Psychrobacter sp. AOP31-A1-22]|uniref:hypothetical protein n=1 Tax=Psychrobacter sp. AOP31-A1-22 TaxID=3457696 RepID=UPI004035998A
MSDTTEITGDKPLSRRDYLAGQAMVAMIEKFGVYEDLYDHVVETTDKMIKALDGESQQ